MFRIYGLVDPTTDRIVYVGKCVTSLKTRLTSHLTKARTGRTKTPTGDWIRRLQAQGLRPSIRLLEASSGCWRTVERAWVARLRAEGCQLLNRYAGGNGAHTRAALAPQFVALLGVISDGRIAKQAGLSRETITYHRRRAGIGKAPIDKTQIKGTFSKGRTPHNKGVLPPEVLALVGQESDRALAEKFGVSRKTIATHRQKAGERAFDGSYHVKGEAHHNSKLTEDLVREIRAAYKPGKYGHGCTALGKKFGVDPTTIYAVVNFKCWENVQ